MGRAAPLAPSLHADIERAASRPISPKPEDDLPGLQALREQALHAAKLPVAERATIERLIGENLIEAGRLDESRATLNAAIASLIQAHQEDTGEMGRLLTALAGCLSGLNDFPGALDASLRAEAILTRVYGASSPELVLTHENLARIYYRMGLIAKAADYYRKATSSGLPAPRNRTDYVSSLVGEAQALSALGDEEASIATYYRALDAAKSILPPDHLGWGMIYSELATHLGTVGRYAEAEPLRSEEHTSELQSH